MRGIGSNTCLANMLPSTALSKIPDSVMDDATVASNTVSTVTTAEVGAGPSELTTVGLVSFCLSISGCTARAVSSSAATVTP